MRRLVGQAEVLPVLVAKVACAKRLKHCKVLWVMDRTLPNAVLGSDCPLARDTAAILGVNAHRRVVLEATRVYSSAFQDEF